MTVSLHKNLRNLRPRLRTTPSPLRSSSRLHLRLLQLLAQSPQSQPLSSRLLRSLLKHLPLVLPSLRSQHCAPFIPSRSLPHLLPLLPSRPRSPTANTHPQSQTRHRPSSLFSQLNLHLSPSRNRLLRPILHSRPLPRLLPYLNRLHSHPLLNHRLTPHLPHLLLHSQWPTTLPVSPLCQARAQPMRLSFQRHLAPSPTLCTNISH